MTADLARRRSVPTVRQATGARFGHYVQVAASAATTRVEAWRPKVARGLVSCSPAPAAGVRAVFSASAAFASGGEGIVSETGVEGLGWLEERISELSERQAANARMVLERLESRSPRCPGAPGEATGHEHAIVRRRDRRGQYAKSRNVQLQRVLFNPDPIAWRPYVHVFVGPAVLTTDVGQACALRDTRFPALTLPDYPGFDLQPNAGIWMNVSLPVPKNLESTTYWVNGFLFHCWYFGMNTIYMDRFQIPWKVT
jgi:hypothetical protein